MEEGNKVRAIEKEFGLKYSEKDGEFHSTMDELTYRYIKRRGYESIVAIFMLIIFMVTFLVSLWYHSWLAWYAIFSVFLVLLAIWSIERFLEPFSTDDTKGFVLIETAILHVLKDHVSKHDRSKKSAKDETSFRQYGE